ncbi:MAG TPA: CoA transferase [Candidatus Binataceae bacterium]|jgi:CoA:oxalate CoA-transferase|nr:CoA transferase [Candidatus Binataceae bacterium]
MAANKPKHILDGIKVLDITNVIAGPSVGNLMIEMGADVIKVEMSPTGDRARFIDAIKPGRGSTFVKHNRGKKSLLLDLKQPAAQAIVKELIPQIDVFVENFAPGAIARMGLGYDAVKAINPRIIMCSVSAFGQTGPLAHAPGYDYIGASYAGVLDVLGGEPDGAPTFPGVAIGDVMASVHAAGAIGYALYHRERTGVGQYLDISLLDSYFYVHDRGTIRHKLSGGSFRMKRPGRFTRDFVPQGIFKGEKHYLCFMVALDKVWGNLCKAMGKPEFGRHPDFATNAKRQENAEQVYKLVQDWLDATPEDEVLRLLDEYHIPAGPLLNVGEAAEHPHMIKRGTVRQVHDPVLGDIELPGPPMRFSEFPDPVDVPAAPNLGEHNMLILKQYLGYSDEKIKQLEEQGLFRKKG